MPYALRTAALLVALLGTAPALHAQRCSWEADLPRRASDARKALARRAVNDSLRAGIVATLRAAGVQEPRGLVAISAARGDDAPVIRTFDANFAAGMLEGLRPGVGEQLKRYPAEAGVPRSAIIRLDTLPLPAARADGKRRECEPILINRAEIAGALQEWRSSPHGLEEPNQSITLAMVLDRSGRVRHSEIVSQGTLALEELARTLANRVTFRAASLDGVAQDVWVVLPISLR